MGKMTSYSAAALLAAVQFAGLSTVAYAGHTNPIDEVSNPTELDYTDESIGLRQLHVPFVRDGVVSEPKLFSTITLGLEQAKVQTALGAPIRQDGRQWDYNFKMKMVGSENYLVCQYKVVFDDQKLVRETVWRRRQCQQLVNPTL